MYQQISHSHITAQHSVKPSFKASLKPTPPLHILQCNLTHCLHQQVGTYLVQHGKLFQQEKISFNHTVLQSLESDNILTVSHSSVETSDITTVQLDNASVDVEPSSSAVAADEEDSWNEDNDTQVERAGVFDTLFTSADFVEDSERAAVYGHIDSGRSDCIQFCSSWG